MAIQFLKKYSYLIIAITLSLVIIVFIIIQQGLKKPESIYPGELQPTIATVVVSKNDPVTLTTDDSRVTIYFPASDLSGSFALVTKQEDPSPTKSSSSEIIWNRQYITLVQFLDASGNLVNELPELLMICFKMDETTWEYYLHAPMNFEVQIYQQSGAISEWDTLPSFPKADQMELCGNSSSVSLFALAIHDYLQEPASSGTLYSP